MKKIHTIISALMACGTLSIMAALPSAGLLTGTDGSKAPESQGPQKAIEKEFTFTLSVTGIETAPELVLYCEPYQIAYPTPAFTKEGESFVTTFRVYRGAHTLTLSAPGMSTIVQTLEIDDNINLNLAMSEDVRAPYNVKAELMHDILTGVNDIAVSWNDEEAIFFDDFENHRPFAIEFSPWTGIDADLTAPAALAGDYANRGLPNYGQIINPKAVTPAWDLNDYFTLAPRSGNQYLGFVQTANGTPLNDWVMTPAITLGDGNIVRFFARSADAVNSRFAVGITTAEHPVAADFEIISEGNEISVDYLDWKEITIDLSAYSGQTVKLGIHCFSPSGAFISMIDDFFVGKPAAAHRASRRVAARSAANPNESFRIWLNDELRGTTTGYDYMLTNVAPGAYTVGVQSCYLNSESPLVTTEIEIDNSFYTPLDLTLQTNNSQTPGEAVITFRSGNEPDAYSFAAHNGRLHLEALPKGSYEVSVSATNYDPFAAHYDISDETPLTIMLIERLVQPYNITADIVKGDEGHDVELRWNRNLSFHDGFEDYENFATGSFGGWTTLDFDTKASYPIGLGSQTNIVSFPGSSSPGNPKVVPPMVFNPHATMPAMSSDAAILAPAGDKSILFQGPQGGTADKWLISPRMTIRDNFEWSVLAKAYDMYPETLEFCISEGDDMPDSFTVLDAVNPPHSQWTQYTLSLTEYAGREVYLAIHCTSFDGFVVQVDEFEVGPSGDAEDAEVGFVKNYHISLNGNLQGVSAHNSYLLPNLADGTYTASVSAEYASGLSAPGELTFTIDSTGVEGVATIDSVIEPTHGGIRVTSHGEMVTVCDLTGKIIWQEIVEKTALIKVQRGVYIIRIGSMSHKIFID